MFSKTTLYVFIKTISYDLIAIFTYVMSTGVVDRYTTNMGSLGSL